MFIRIPGTTVEGDFAHAATSHASLEQALADLEQLTGADTLTILDTNKVPLAVVATVVAFDNRADAVENYQTRLPVKPAHAELRDVTRRTSIVVRRFT